MTHIQPQDLLRVLSPLLNKSGGIINIQEVKRVSSLMDKFSNKLVSRVMYLLILQKTEKELLSEFMAVGGWGLVFKWLGDAVNSNQYAVIKEILNLLLLCPIELDRLKENHCPKVVKGLSKESEDPDVRHIAGLIVEKWLHFIKGKGAALKTAQPEPPKFIVEPAPETTKEPPEILEEHLDEVAPNIEEKSPSPQPMPPATYKISVRDGKHVSPSKIIIRAVKAKPEATKSEMMRVKLSDSNTIILPSEVIDERKEERRKDKVHSSKDKPSHKSSSSSSSSSRKSEYKSSHRDKKSSKDVTSSSSSTSSSKSDKDKEKDMDKEKDSMSQLKTAISALGKIPKKITSAPEKSSGSGSPLEPQGSSRKGSYSDERHRTSSTERPKTVKTLPTKFRSTGLEEAAKPPPSRADLKNKKVDDKRTVEALKRPSKETKSENLPEKKFKAVDSFEKKEKSGVDKPGGVKLIPAKPKPMILESDMFSDALTASTKLEPRKKKRRSSSSTTSTSGKDDTTRKELNDDVNTSSPQLSSPTREAKMPRFYRDTLEDGDDESKDKENSINKGKISPAANNATEETKKDDDETPRPKYYPESLLITRIRRGPKKVVRWKTETQLVSTHFFELDETERVNVSRAFVDLKAMERTKEREALLHSRKLSGLDKMEEQIPWRIPDIVDIPQVGDPIINGINSQEKDIQYAREKTVLQAIYFDKSMVPPTPSEPDPETHTAKAIMPTPTIPLEDVTSGGSGDVALHDHSAAGWPEPRVDPNATATSVPPSSAPMTHHPLTQAPSHAPYAAGINQAQPPSIGPYGVPPPPPFAGMQGGAGIIPPPAAAAGAAAAGQPELWRNESSDIPQNMPYTPNPIGPIYPMGPGFGPPPPGAPYAYPPNGFPPGYQGMGAPPMYGGPPPAPMGIPQPPPPNWGWPRGPPRPLNPKNICNAWKKGQCTRGAFCRFLHPGVNCPPIS